MENLAGLVEKTQKVQCNRRCQTTWESNMKIKLFIAVILVGEIAMSALPTKTNIIKAQPAVNQTDLYHQLTGRNKVNSKLAPKIVASAEKALTLARQSRDSKNYILAIKRYNFILKYFSKSAQAKLALIDKSMMYKEMGLPEQAAYNQKKLSKLSNLPTTLQKTIKR